LSRAGAQRGVSILTTGSSAEIDRS
jgi:hypothetical protein